MWHSTHWALQFGTGLACVLLWQVPAFLQLPLGDWLQDLPGTEEPIKRGLMSSVFPQDSKYSRAGPNYEGLRTSRFSLTFGWGSKPGRRECSKPTHDPGDWRVPDLVYLMRDLWLLLYQVKVEGLSRGGDQHYEHTSQMADEWCIQWHFCSPCPSYVFVSRGTSSNIPQRISVIQRAKQRWISLWKIHSSW